MAWYEKAKKIHEENPNLTHDEVANMFDRAGKTYRNRLYEEQRLQREINKALKTGEEYSPSNTYEVNEVNEVYYIKGTNHSCSISKDELRRLKILYCEQNMTAIQTCREMGMLQADFQLIRRAFDITHDDAPYLDEDFLSRNTDDLVEESVEREKREFFIKLKQKRIDSERRELRKYREKNYFYTKITEELVEEIQNLNLNKSLFKNLSPIKMQTKKKSGKSLVLNLADTHKGKLILGSKMPTGNHHDGDTFRRKIEKVILCTEEMLSNNSYDYFYIINYGDSLDDPDALTYNKQVLHQYSRGENQIIGLLQIMQEMLIRFSKLTHVHYVGVPGNHSKNIVNWDTLLNQLLETLFQNYEGITFECTDKASKVIHIYNNDIVITHGNHISSAQSKGEIDTLNIFRMYGLNSKQTYLIQGHLHHYESTKYRRIFLPSIVGGDDLAENMMNITSRPAQLLCTFSDEGLIQENHIYLD